MRFHEPARTGGRLARVVERLQREVRVLDPGFLERAVPTPVNEEAREGDHVVDEQEVWAGRRVVADVRRGRVRPEAAATQTLDLAFGGVEGARQIVVGEHGVSQLFRAFELFEREVAWCAGSELGLDQDEDVAAVWERLDLPARVRDLPLGEVPASRVGVNGNAYALAPSLNDLQSRDPIEVLLVVGLHPAGEGLH